MPYIEFWYIVELLDESKFHYLNKAPTDSTHYGRKRRSRIIDDERLNVFFFIYVKVDMENFTQINVFQELLVVLT